MARTARCEVDPQYVRGTVGALVVLHTWTHQLHYHPHVHCLVTGGGISEDNGNQSCDLRYAGKDARSLRDALVKQSRPLYNNVITLLLAHDGDKPPTKANIEDALEDMLGKAGSADTTVVFIAGHGVTNDRGADYLFLPEGAELAGQSWRKSTVRRASASATVSRSMSHSFGITPIRSGAVVTITSKSPKAASNLSDDNLPITGLSLELSDAT
jgi:hypothetical protein